MATTYDIDWAGPSVCVQDLYDDPRQRWCSCLACEGTGTFRFSRRAVTNDVLGRWVNLTRRARGPHFETADRERAAVRANLHKYRLILSRLLELTDVEAQLPLIVELVYGGLDVADARQVAVVGMSSLSAGSPAR